jgi:hypothetical protein
MNRLSPLCLIQASNGICYLLVYCRLHVHESKGQIHYVINALGCSVVQCFIYTLLMPI